MNRIKLIIFDLDGTIADAYEAIEKSLNYTREKYGYPAVSPLTVRRAVGWGNRKFIETFFSEKDVEAASGTYKKHHKVALLKYSRAMPGAKELLSFLKKRKIRLAIASNRPLKFTSILLRRLGLKKYFNAVSCAKDTDEIKPKPTILLRAMKRLGVKKSETIYVGDMVIDVRAGKRAGVTTIAVLGGSSPAAALKKAKPHSIISKISGVKLLLPEA